MDDELNINESLNELESLLKDNHTVLETKKVDTDNLFNIFEDIKKLQIELKELSKKLYENP
jgi:hypothetical protein